MEKKVLECVDLNYHVGGRTLFGGLSFRVEAGDLVWLKGRNGVGKSTLLRLAAGIIRPDSGAIRWTGDPREILYIGHKSAIKQTLTVAEMLAFWGRLYGSESLQNAALHYFDLEPFSEVLCGSLSAGWKQKLTLGRLILQPATLWLLDEPASHLDDDGLELLQSLISTRKEQGGLVMLAMHGSTQAKDIKIIEIK